MKRRDKRPQAAPGRSAACCFCGGPATAACSAVALDTVIQSGVDIQRGDLFLDPRDQAFRKVTGIEKLPHYTVLSWFQIGPERGRSEPRVHEGLRLTFTEGRPYEIANPYLPYLVRILQVCGRSVCGNCARELDDDVFRCPDHAPRVELEIEQLRREVTGNASAA